MDVVIVVVVNVPWYNQVNPYNFSSQSEFQETDLFRSDRERTQQF
jgi:hypothetical protein